MPFAPVVSTYAQSVGGITATTPAIDTSGCGLLVAFIAQGATFVPTVTDNKGNAWTALTRWQGGPTAWLFYKMNPVVGAGHTFTVTCSGGDAPSIAVAGFSGTVAAFDKEVGAWSGGATGLALGPVTPAVEGELCIMGVCGDVKTMGLVTNGFVVLQQMALVPGNAWGFALAYQIQKPTTARAVTFTNAGGASGSVFTGTLALFKPATLYPHGDWKMPIVAQTRQATIDSQRVNLAALRDELALTGVLQGWNYAILAGSADQPTTITYTRGAELVWSDIAWATVAGAPAVTLITHWYSPDAGLDVNSPTATWWPMTDAAGNFVARPVYDANGNFNGMGWSTS